jgi:hypothetical protein
VGYAYWEDSLVEERAPGQRRGQPLANLGFRNDKDDERRKPVNGRAESPLKPPGGILIVALLSGVSGAIMGLLFGGHVTIAIAALVSLTLGLALGLWSPRTGD